MEAQKKVYDTYAVKAHWYKNEGYRSQWWYLANKALSDWDLLGTIDLANKTVLNIGCSEPIDEILFVRKVKQWVALDNNERMLDVAKKIVDEEMHPDLGKKISFVKADATKLPFPNEIFDIVLSFSTIEHLPNPHDRKTMIQEMARVTKRGGYCVITTSNRWNIFYRWWSSKQQKKGKTDFGYEYFFSPLQLKDMLIAAKLKPIYFTSNWQPILPGTGEIKHFFLRLFWRLKYFGYRMGYLCEKP